MTSLFVEHFGEKNANNKLWRKTKNKTEGQQIKVFQLGFIIVDEEE